MPAFLLLWDRDSMYGLGIAFPRPDGIHLLDEVRAQPAKEFVRGHAIDSRAAFVCLDLLAGSGQAAPI